MLTGKRFRAGGVRTARLRAAPAAMLLVGMSAIALAVTACGPANTPTAGTGSSTATVSTTPNPPTSTSPTGSPTSPVSAPSSGGSGTNQPGTGTLVPLPPYASVPPSQINERGMSTEQPTAVQTAEGGRIVLFHAEQAGCQSISAQVQSQTSTQVVVDVVVTSTAGPGKACPMIVRVVPVTVSLNAPLGSRTLVFQETVKH